MPIRDKIKKRIYDRNLYHKNRREKRIKQMKEYYKKHSLKMKERVKQRNRSIEGHKKTMFQGIKNRIKLVKTYKNRKLLFTLQDFLNFLPETKYIEIHQRWAKNGYKKKFAPSIDRIDNDGNYELDNIQIITHGENSQKEIKLIMQCPNCKQNLSDFIRTLLNEYKEEVIKLIEESIIKKEEDDNNIYYPVFVAGCGDVKSYNQALNEILNKLNTL